MINIVLEMDPVGLSVNKRFRSNSTVHPDVVKLQKEIVKECQHVMKREKPLQRDTFLRLTLIYTFRTFRADLDNPIKRTIDALAEGLDFNDSRIYEIHVYRRVGGTEVWAQIEEIPAREVPMPEGYLPPEQEPTWVMDEGTCTLD
jgi:Holliday junction resolvase RusA-like endonuclease